jgi:hypothetical protein
MERLLTMEQAVGIESKYYPNIGNNLARIEIGTTRNFRRYRMPARRFMRIPSKPPAIG